MRPILLILILLAFTEISAQKKFSDSVLNNPLAYADRFERLFKTVEKPKAELKAVKSAAVLENGYSLSKIKNPENWNSVKSKNVPTQVEVIYTKYPKDKEFWLTNYHQLLANRLKALFEIDERLNHRDIKFVIILQTACETDEEARAMFHGFVIRYRPKTKDELKKDALKKSEEPAAQDSIPGSPSGYSTIKRFVKNAGGMADSMVYKSMERNKNKWDKLAIVCDWTTSNYQYAVQSILWHMNNMSESPITTFTFFNDGDEKYEFDKEIGKTGGLYYADATKTAKIVQAFNNSMRKGLGGDFPENDVEAILRTIQKYPNTKNIGLVADNSPVRDMELLDSITLPVRVILQGCEYGINPQYINIAYKTGGSLHTLLGDYSYEFLSQRDSIITIDNQKFRFDYESDQYVCMNPLKCAALEKRIAQREEEIFNDLSSKKVYRGMHKDKKPSGINTFFHWLIGK